MCGIAGFLDRAANIPADQLDAAVKRMTDCIAHRGPDDEGHWTDAQAGIALGQRRLSIIDLSPLGHQPMATRSGRYVVTYNGEIYNYRELRAELEAAGVAFRGHSDTEVMIEGFALWGIQATLKKLVGMFALALWDRETRTLTLARDHLGIKPIYWSFANNRLAFGSELKTILALDDTHPAIDRDAVVAYLRHAYVPAPRTIYRGVFKLPPGSHLTLAPGAEPVIGTFWTAHEAAMKGLANPVDWSDAEATDRLDALLRDAVGRQMIADVPLGAFLSGGIDSSTVVAQMQASSNRPVKTFSIGFNVAGYDEADHAKAVAAHLGTDHTELYVEPEHALGVIPRLADWYDEPFADSSQIPTFLVSEMTRRQVTVALSGDGGDELFGGYNRYFLGQSIWNRVSSVPGPLRRSAACAVRSISPQRWNAILGVLPRRHRERFTGDRIHKLARILGLDAPDEIYRSVISQWQDPQSVVLGGTEPASVLTDPSVPRDIPTFFERMQYLDTVTYLPDDILTKVDRASMAVALEARVPLLDHRVVEFAWALPAAMKHRGGEGKWLLRQVLDRYVPRSLTDRPKMGFGVPIDSWLRGPLRDWAEDLLDEKALREDGVFDPAPIRKQWAEHLTGRHNWQYPLWTILMFQAWRRRWQPSFT